MRLFKQLWVLGLRRVRDEYEDAQADIEHSSPIVRIALLVFIGYVVITVSVGIYWSFYPAPINIKTAVQSLLAEKNLPATSTLPAGIATTATLIAVTETLWQKPGGYLT